MGKSTACVIAEGKLLKKQTNQPAKVGSGSSCGYLCARDTVQAEAKSGSSVRLKEMQMLLL